MKGIMVPLLTICMTGMVMGQQPRNNASQFGNSFRNPASAGQAHSILSSNSNSAAPNSTNPSAVNQSGPLEMVLTDKLMQDFRTKGQLSAMIQPRQYVNEIIFLHENNKKSASASGNMSPKSKTGEVLRFELDELDLQRIRRQGLKYSFDPFEQGRYKQVVVDYRSSGLPSANSRFQNASSGNSTQGTNQTGGFGQPSGYLPAPAPDYSRPFDPHYMGPTIPRDVLARANRRDSNSTLGDPRWGSSASPTNLASDSLGSRNRGFGTGTTFQDRSTGSGGSTDRTASRTNWPDQNTTFTAPQLTDQQSRFQPINADKIQNSNWNNSANRRTGSTSNALSEAELLQQDLERRQAELIQRNLDLQKQKLAELEEANRLEEQAILEQRRSMDQVRADIARRNATNLNAAEQDFLGRQGYDSPSSQAGLASNSPGSYSDQLVNGYRTASNRQANLNSPQPTAGGVRSLAAAIQGPQNPNAVGSRDAGNAGNRGELLGENRNEEKTEGIIYFMLLFSLGLNVYLGWISRGFYVRYNELADELRETFTATM